MAVKPATGLAGFRGLKDAIPTAMVIAVGKALGFALLLVLGVVEGTQNRAEDVTHRFHAIAR